VTEASLELARLMHQHNNDTKGAVKVCSRSSSPRETFFFFAAAASAPAATAAHDYREVNL
jgi:hypothetical protein